MRPLATIAAGAWLHLGRAQGTADTATGFAALAKSMVEAYEPQIIKRLDALPLDQAWALAITLRPWREALERIEEYGRDLGAEGQARAEQLRKPAHAALATLDRRGLGSRAASALRGALAGWKLAGSER